MYEHRALPYKCTGVMATTATTIDESSQQRDRVCGALIGLACGDAVGTTVEFQRRGNFPEVKDMVGGGPFKLEPGQWTDDTSLALCLAQSLIERKGHDPRDQLVRFSAWREKGKLSSNGSCFDIGNATAYALDKFRWQLLLHLQLPPPFSCSCLVRYIQYAFGLPSCLSCPPRGPTLLLFTAELSTVVFSLRVFPPSRSWFRSR